MSSVALVKDVISRAEVTVSSGGWTNLLPTSAPGREGVFLFNSGSVDVLYRLKGAAATAPSGTPSRGASSGVLLVGETRYLAIGADVLVYAASVAGSGSVALEEVA
ncbi:hypothetical protein QPK87_04840 [Kamptonema cortianum]|nr:hypothetical protein [Geitlerinema splendidum]MDK3155903.1 hypothetical protein [Kamptonema cortianum]